uniref:Uncharacterized protein n=1 Tax=Sphaerodactylus townsendi TaxID=933632 RepID=A0ACB8FS41_9SAUR
MHMCERNPRLKETLAQEETGKPFQSMNKRVLLKFAIFRITIREFIYKAGAGGRFDIRETLCPGRCAYQPQERDDNGDNKVLEEKRQEC